MRSAKRMVSADRIRQIAEQPDHLMRRLEMPLGIGLEPAANGFDRGLFADAGQHVLQRTARGMVIEHLVGGKQRHTGIGGEIMQPRETTLVVAAIEQARGQPDAVGGAGLQPREQIERFRRLEPMRQRQHQKLAFCEIDQIGQREPAVALLHPLEFLF
ncbi:hypothetical protein [Bradyrhizobium sp. USDA 4454]